jgi:hypothetical protein
MCSTIGSGLITNLISGSAGSSLITNLSSGTISYQVQQPGSGLITNLSSEIIYDKSATTQLVV